MSNLPIGHNPPPKFLDEWNGAKKVNFLNFCVHIFVMLAKNSLKNQNYYVFLLKILIKGEFKTASINPSK
jgi:hypothetical protein